jgi:hypothetical protein
LTAQACKPITNQNHTQSRYDPRGSSCDWEELPTKLVGITHQLREIESEKHSLTSLRELGGNFHMQKNKMDFLKNKEYFLVLEKSILRYEINN